MERSGERRGELKDMAPDGTGRVRLEYLIPARGLIGFQLEFLTLTRGTGLITTSSTTTGRASPAISSGGRTAC